MFNKDEDANNISKNCGSVSLINVDCYYCKYFGLKLSIQYFFFKSVTYLKMIDKKSKCCTDFKT